VLQQTSLCTTLLTPLAYWSTSVSRNISFLSLFSSWLEGLLVLGCRTLSVANWVSHSNISISNPSYISLTLPWMEDDIEIYDETALNRPQLRSAIALPDEPKNFGYKVNLIQNQRQKQLVNVPVVPPTQTHPTSLFLFQFHMTNNHFH